jgi:hypothetical protein
MFALPATFKINCHAKSEYGLEARTPFTARLILEDETISMALVIFLVFEMDFMRLLMSRVFGIKLANGVWHIANGQSHKL